MNKRIVVEAINGSKVSVSEWVNDKKDIKRVWTLYDEKQVLQNAPFNPFTGKPVETVLDAVLEHNKGVFLEDYVHDWNIREKELYIYSRVIALNKPITLLIELNLTDKK